MVQMRTEQSVISHSHNPGQTRGTRFTKRNDWLSWTGRWVINRDCLSDTTYAYTTPPSSKLYLLQSVPYRPWYFSGLCGVGRSSMWRAFEWVNESGQRHSSKRSAVNFLDVRQQLTHVTVQALQRHTHIPCFVDSQHFGPRPIGNIIFQDSDSFLNDRPHTFGIYFSFFLRKS